MKRRHGMPAWVDSPPVLAREVKHRFGAAGALLGQSPPAGIAHTRRAIPDRAMPYEIDIGVVLVGRPVPLEIVEERRPVGKQPMHLEITQREGKAVVDADQRRRILRKPLRKSLCVTSTMQGNFIDGSKKKPGPKTGLSLLCFFH
jgi:hypothetical protein